MLLKYGRADLLFNSELATDEQAGLSASAAQADDLASDLEHLDPTFVKLGQPLSTRCGLLPPDALRSLSRLPDDVEPFRGERLAGFEEAEFRRRLGELFAESKGARIGEVPRAV